MKTFHRLMYETLMYDEWKELLKVDIRYEIKSMSFEHFDASKALNGGFLWSDTVQGEGYWLDIFLRLLENEECSK